MEGVIKVLEDVKILNGELRRLSKERRLAEIEKDELLRTDLQYKEICSKILAGNGLSAMRKAIKEKAQWEEASGYNRLKESIELYNTEIGKIRTKLRLLPIVRRERV